MLLTILQGFLNLNKPAGFTSHDCVARVRRLVRIKRVGHGGTLDPAARGVLPIAIGRATRLLQFLPQGKAYQATIRFGIRTTTDDLEGEILSKVPVASLELDSIRQVLPDFLGLIEQIPPRYSAVQVGGKRLYDLARSGQSVDIPVRKVEVDEIRVLDWRPGDYPELDVAIACGGGTYIRSIARDLGENLGVGGTLAALLRTHSSGFSLNESLTLEELETQIRQGTFKPISPDWAMRHLAIVTLTDPDAYRWCNGQKIVLTESDVPRPVEPLFQVHDQHHTFLGIAQAVIGEQPGHIGLRPKVVSN
jgi:tRNA pseudouridine55 synthase